MKTRNKSCVAFFAILVMMLAMKISANAMMLIEQQGGVFVNGAKVEFPDAKPFMDSQDRIQVPVRPVCEALGAELDWSEKTQTVTITRGAAVVKLVINSKAIEINGMEKQMDTAAMIRDSRTYVPVRFVSEAFGATVDWLEELDVINITLHDQTENIIDIINTISKVSESANVFVTQIDIFDRQIMIEGTASLYTDIPQFQEELRNSGLFSNINVSKIERKLEDDNELSASFMFAMELDVN